MSCMTIVFDSIAAAMGLKSEGFPVSHTLSVPPAFGWPEAAVAGVAVALGCAVGVHAAAMTPIARSRAPKPCPRRLFIADLPTPHDFECRMVDNLRCDGVGCQRRSAAHLSLEAKLTASQRALLILLGSLR